MWCGSADPIRDANKKGTHRGRDMSQSPLEATESFPDEGETERKGESMEAKLTYKICSAWFRMTPISNPRLRRGN